MYKPYIILYTPSSMQYADRDAAGSAPCASKFMFLPNSAYAFTVHATSYHSVDTVASHHGERRTFMVNWYDHKLKDRKGLGKGRRRGQ